MVCNSAERHPLGSILSMASADYVMDLSSSPSCVPGLDNLPGQTFISSEYWPTLTVSFDKI